MLLRVSLTMATVPQFCNFSCKNLSSNPLISPKLAPNRSILLHLGTINQRPSGLTRDIARVRPEFKIRTALDDEWGPEKDEGSAVSVAEKPDEESAVEVSEIARLKKALVDSLYGTNRGLSATSETRAEIVELITQLESKNPTPAPTEALSMLNGKWILA